MLLHSALSAAATATPAGGKVGVSRTALQVVENALESSIESSIRNLKVDDYDTHTKASCETVTEMKELSAAYEKAVKQEIELTAEQLVVATVGKVDAKKRIEDSVMQLMSTNIVQLLGTMLDTVVF